MNDFLKLIWSNETQCEPLYKVGPYERNCYILHYIVSGKGSIEYAGKRYEARQGQMFVIYKGDMISYCADREDPWKYIWADFDGMDAEKLLSATAFSREMRVSPVLPEQEIYPIMKKMYGKMGTLSAEMEGSGLLLMLFSLLIRFFPSERKEDCEVAERAALLIRTGFSDCDCRIEKVAEMIGLSRSQLFRVFRQKYGISPKEYLTECRLLCAKNLLAEGNLGISQVGYACGYADALYFSSEFRRKEGISPGAYRKSKQKKVN